MTKEEKRFGLIQPDTEKGNHIFLKKILTTITARIIKASIPIKIQMKPTGTYAIFS